MTIKLEALRRVFRARQQLRDQAAAEVTVAQQLENERRASSEVAENRRAQLVAGSEKRLKEATSVAELELLANEIAAAEQEITTTQTELVAATNTREQCASVLRAKEKDVRIAQKVVAKRVAAVEKKNERSEQTLNDDLAARRGKGLS